MKQIQIGLVIFLLLCNSQLWAETKAEQAARYLQQAAQYSNDKKYSKAENYFKKVIQLNVPLHKDFYYYYGRVQLKVNKPEEAQESLTAYLQATGKKGRFYKQALSVSQKLAQKQEKKQTQKQQIERQRKSRASRLITGTPKMLKVKKGDFIMGAKFGDEDQKPPIKIKIKRDFAISQSEVTFSQYDRFATETSRKLPDDQGWGRGKRPVINVSLHDAIAYTDWLSDKNDRTYRLPTEAEWEFVAKVKAEQKKTFGYKNLIGRGDANCDGGRKFWETAQTKEVGSYKPNPIGVFDIFGNVWEWTCSSYTQKYNGEEQRCLPVKKMNGKTIAVRGGSWRSHARTLRHYVRYNNFPDFYHDDLGFRIVEELK